MDMRESNLYDKANKILKIIFCQVHLFVHSLTGGIKFVLRHWHIKIITQAFSIYLLKKN